MHASRRQKKARARPFSPPTTSQQQHPHLQAQPAYKVAKLVRGQQGFGFTISGQAPCILSCVVPHSSADRAGLHTGDCLLAVNGCDVSRAPHDEVVRLVGSCMGTLRLHLAESGIPTTPNGYSSSDDASDTKLRTSSSGKSRPAQRNRHPNRMKRKGMTPPSRAERVVRDIQSGMMATTSSSSHHHPALAPPHPLLSPVNGGTGGKPRRRRRHSSDSSRENIACLMASPSLHVRTSKSNGLLNASGIGGGDATGQLMYRSVVGYLGTIEMPEDSGGSSQSSPGSTGGAGPGGLGSSSGSAAARLAAIRSCVRRLRVEKKVHTLVLLRVWGPRPGATAAVGGAGAAHALSGSSSGKITLTSPAGANLARFPARRVVFCGAYADDARFFGLVTSASTGRGGGNNGDSSDSSEDDEDDGPASASDPEAARMLHTRKNSGFTSCHVFMVDSRLVAHEGHAARAHAFRFQCTPDAAAVVDANAALGGSDGRCLEFPPTAEPILQAVLSLCNSSGCHSSSAIGSGLMGWASPLLQQQQQHHQQQHQHNLSSHSSSSSSSSNSDSGIFRDRDDSGKLSDRDVIQNHHQQLMMQRAPHPHNQQQQQNHHQHRQQPVPMNRDLDRLTVRAMPVKSPGEVEHAARLRSSMQRYLRTQQQLRPSQISTSTSNSSVQAASMLLLNRNTGTHQHGPSTASGITTSASAINPSLSVRATMTLEEKLSPQVYKGGIAGVRPSLSSNRPIRTPSERSRARSLDDLSKSGSPSLRHHHLGTSPPSSEDHHHYSPHYNYRVMGSDNGLDRIDWDDHHEYSRPSFHTTGSWHHSLASTSSKTMRDDEDDDDHSREEVVGPRIQQQHHHHHHLHEKNHVQQLENINEKASQPPQQPQQQHAWTQGFEKLLEDPLGLRAFAEFLKKEFSHENIYFWAACERFHRLFPTPSGDPMSDEALQHDDATTRLEAQKIFERHLGPTASEPVNVDSQARQMAEDHLNQPGPELFDQAQKQVFNLMKYDCYPRFLRSVIYRQCVEALESHRPPPVPEPTLSDPDLNIDYNCGPGSSLGDGDNDSLNRNMALKKSESDAGERRRRSLLPWPKKDRSKSKDRGEIEYRKTNKKKNRLGSTGSSNCADKDKENGTDCDDDSQQQRQQTALMMKRAASRDSVASEFSDRAFHIQSSASSIPLVKVLLPDLSSAVIAARPGQSVQQLLNKLLDRRGLKFSAFELYDQHASTAIELERDASMLAGLEVRLEPRSVFHLLLVSSGKSLMIRGQPRRQLGEVLKPILIKYGLKMEQSVIVKAVTGETVPSKTLLAALDGFHLKVSDRDAYGENPDQEDSSAHLQDEPTEIKNACSSRESNSGSLLGRNRGLVRRNSLQATERSRTISAKKSGNTTTIRHHGDSSHSFSASASSKRLSLHDLSSKSGGSPTAHLMPPPRAPLGSRKLISTRNPLSRLENEALYERLKRAQRSRLEDQRGTEINTELPDFLKLPGGGGGDGSAGAGSYSGESHEIPIDGRASEPILGCRPRLVYQQSYEIPLDGRASEPIFSRREVVSEPYGSRGSILSGLSAALSGSCTSPDFAAIAAQILDKSFSADGLLPTHEQAEKYFSGPSPAGTLDLKSSKTNNSNGMLNQPTTKITVAAAKQTVATVAARIAAIEQNDRMLHGANRQASKSGSNSNWDDLLLDLDVDWRCYQGRSETDDQKQQQQHQHSRPRISSSSTQPLQQQQQQQPISCRPPLPVPPQQQVSHSHAHLEMLDLDDPLVATGSTVTAPPPLPPKPGKAKLSDAFKAPSAHQPVPPPRPPSRNVNTVSRVNVSFV